MQRTISRDGSGRKKPANFEWISRPMKARVDLADKEGVRTAADTHKNRPYKDG